MLFADVAGSMDLQERLDAEVWAHIMGRFVSILAEGVRKFGGTVDKFTGDGIMALFGAPVAQEDHARRACHAARHLIRAIAEYSEALRGEHGVELHVRLGLNSGEVVVGRVGEDVMLDPTALGHTVGLAQRMEAMAEPGTAYLSEYTARSVEGWFALENRGARAVKGARERLEVSVLGEPLSSSVRRTFGSSPLVGRDRELAVLEDALALAGDRQFQVVGVVGEAGVGKSRLCDEFGRSLAARGITVRRAAGVSHGKDVPLLPILAFQREYFGIADGDEPADARGKVTERLLALDSGLEDALPLLFDFLEVPDPDRPVPPMAPEVRMRRIFDAVRRITARRSEREMLVLIFEDLHWFDSQSAAFLERLIESYPGSRTLVVANFRPEFAAGWMRHSYYRQLPLGPLPNEAVNQLLDRLLGADRSSFSLVSFILEHTEGNPFFIEELIRTLVEDGTLVGSPGNYRLAGRPDAIRVPPSVTAVLAARIDRLSPNEKEMLQTAAVIGREFTRPLLGQVLGTGAEDTDDVLAALGRAELLQWIGSDEYRFWHPLTQQVAYGSLLAGRRSRIHGAVARALIETNPSRLNERSALIAAHFAQAGERLEAARWEARAADWALRTDISESMHRLRSALAWLDGLPVSDDARELGIAVRARLLQRGARQRIDDAEADRLFREGHALATSVGDVRRMAAVTQFHGSVKIVAGRFQEALAAYREAARLGALSGEADLRAATLVPLAVIRRYTGPLQAGLDASDTAMAIVEDNADAGSEYLGYSALARIFIDRANLFALLGRLDEARKSAGEGLAAAQHRSDPECTAWALTVYPAIADVAGEPDTELREKAEQAAKLAEQTGNAMIQLLAAEALTLSHIVLGQPDQATKTCLAALETSRSTGTSTWVEALLLGLLARARAGVGDLSAAMRSADESLAVAGRQGAPVVQCLTLLTKAQLGRVAGAPDHAVLADLDAARTLVEKTGAVTYDPFIHEELGRLQNEDRELAEAVRLYRQIGATGHARRLEAELRSKVTP